ncbi:hypothetical protein NP493_559g00034 [Ridgeia piscesae]|uniref:Tetraspanin n=1 Tax=Ridgeia piscesae TaxID=27915 RepID=A0AAD9KVI7_RIDPI|nr:hypothetical protein NP493_559g00034 [Ridgeia piscesae]
MSRLKQEPGSCVQCVEYIMYSINVLFFVIGGVTVGIGVWIIYDKDYMSPLFGTELMTVSAYLIVAGGVSLVLFSFVGCMAAFYQNKSLLLMYFVVMLLMFLILVIGGILASIFRSQVRDEIREYMKRSLINHYDVDLDKKYNRLITDAWDTAQKELHCCAVDEHSWNLYKGSEWYKKSAGKQLYERALVPESCCEKPDRAYNLEKCQKSQQGPPGKTSGQFNEFLHYRGCYRAGRDFVWEFSGYLIGMGFGIAIVMIAGMVFSLLLFRQID